MKFDVYKLKKIARPMNEAERRDIRDIEEREENRMSYKQILVRSKDEHQTVRICLNDKSNMRYLPHKEKDMKKAFSEYAINGKTAKNRFIRSATNTHLDNIDGTISDAEIEMYDALGQGEVGTIITGHMSVSPDLEYRADICQPSIGADEYLPGLKRVAEKSMNTMRLPSPRFRLQVRKDSLRLTSTT